MRYGIVDGVNFLSIESLVKDDYISLDGVLNNLQDEFDKISTCVSNDELSGLCDSYQKEIDELKKINNKILKYDLTLKEIYDAYEVNSQNIYQEIVHALSKTERIEENGKL